MSNYRSNVILNGAVFDICTDPSVSRLVDHIHTIAKRHGFATINMADENGVSPTGEVMYKIVDVYSTHTVGEATVRKI